MARNSTTKAPFVFDETFYDAFTINPHYDTPISCTPLKPFEAVERDNIVAELRLHYADIMAGDGTLEQRLHDFKIKAKGKFEQFGLRRRGEYQTVRCMYYGEDWNRAGNSSWSRIACQPGFELMPSTLERTTDGDWKGGPVFDAANTTMDWKTGGHGSSRTFARIWARYNDKTVRAQVRNELVSIQSALLQSGIPSDLPPDWA